MLVEDWQLLEGLLGTMYPTIQVSNFLGHFNFALCMKWACIQVNVDVLALAHFAHTKGSHPERKVQFFLNIVQKAFDPQKMLSRGLFYKVSLKRFPPP